MLHTTTFHLNTDLASIAALHELRQDENDAFREFLQVRQTAVVDALVHQLNDTITTQVNCLDCGNCCRSLMINVEEHEIAPVAKQLQMNTQQVKENYLEISEQGQMVMNTIPCAFLQQNACTVYQNRFSECREFPHLHKPNFNGRLFGTFMHYGRCPIIFNVVEALKIELGFHNNSHEILDEALDNTNNNYEITAPFM